DFLAEDDEAALRAVKPQRDLRPPVLYLELRQIADRPRGRIPKLGLLARNAKRAIRGAGHARQVRHEEDMRRAVGAVNALDACPAAGDGAAAASCVGDFAPLQ